MWLFRSLCGTVKDFFEYISKISNSITDIQFNDLQRSLDNELNTFLQLLQKEEFAHQTRNVIHFSFSRI